MANGKQTNEGLSASSHSDYVLTKITDLTHLAQTETKCSKIESN